MSGESPELTAIRMRAEAPIPRHRLTQSDKDRRTLLGIVDRLQLDLFQTREAKAAALETNALCRRHHAAAHPDCMEVAA